MNRLPEPPARQPHATQAGQPTPEALHRAAQIAAAVDAVYDQPTSYRDRTSIPAIGTTPPVAQPDSRRVPSWATGLAVGSIGIGAGATGLGCAAWLVFKGLALVSVPSLQTFALILLAPFAGIALAAVAIGAAIAKAKRASTTNIYKGSVQITKTEVHSTTRGLWASTRNQLPPGRG
ncbi:hypothetical protein ACFZAR_36070 [Streptomyces sp. NPDC008222]|uniref:hypothetical protein n=1 Tax=Streptomyces sp. NPDC008222 TaxID=3364820 RepID=UPI0036EB26CB